MTLVVALREATRWKRLRPWWSPQQRGRRNSLSGVAEPQDKLLCHVWLLFLRFTCITCICLYTLTSFLGFGLDLWFRGLLVSRKALNILISPLDSGVVSCGSHKVHLSTYTSFPVGVGTTDSLRRNFWQRWKFWPKLSGLSTVANKWLWVLYRIFRYAYSPPSRHCLDPFNWYQSKVFF